MKELADLIHAIASLSWPILVAVVIIYYRREIRDALRRLKRGKLFGQELELSESLDKLNESAVAVSTASTSALIPPVKPLELELGGDSLPAMSDGVDVRSDDIDVRMILQQAEYNLTLAFITLENEIEKALREILFSQGHPDDSFVTIANAVRMSQVRNFLPSETINALLAFENVKNRIVHASNDVTNDEVLRGIDSGLIILKALKAIARQVKASSTNKQTGSR